MNSYAARWDGHQVGLERIEIELMMGECLELLMFFRRMNKQIVRRGERFLMTPQSGGNWRDGKGWDQMEKNKECGRKKVHLLIEGIICIGIIAGWMEVGSLLTQLSI